MKRLSDRATEVVHRLIGTSATLDSVLSDNEQLDEKLLAEIDDQIFLCEVCSWWCDTSEQEQNENGETVCEDCNEE